MIVWFSFSANKERPASPGKEGGKTTTKGEKKKGKDKGKDKDKDKDKDKGNLSRPPSQQFDITKPNWTLRVVLDQTPTVREKQIRVGVGE